MEQNINQVDIKSLSKEQRAELLAQLKQEEKDDRIARREAYEALRGEFMHAVRGRRKPSLRTSQVSRNGLRVRRTASPQ